MENYVRVRPPRDQDAETDPNEVRITTSGRMKHYISYAVAHLVERDQPQVALRAMGKAINKTVAVAEIVKRRVAGLHQVTTIFTEDVTDVWEPKEGTEGLDRIETTRHGAVIRILLSKDPLDENLPGYQAPLPEDQVKPLGEDGDLGSDDGRGEGRRGRGRGRGRARGRGRGRGRSRGRGGRGRPREGQEDKEMNGGGEQAEEEDIDLVDADEDNAVAE